MAHFTETSWERGLTCMAPADIFSPAELNARPDRDWNPWICNNRLLMAATDTGGAHEVKVNHNPLLFVEKNLDVGNHNNRF